jgi:hypothetical protein
MEPTACLGCRARLATLVSTLTESFAHARRAMETDQQR